MPAFVQPSIPASLTVNVIPNVVPAGGGAIDLLGLLLTPNIRVPIGQILSFAETDTETYFGSLSQEAALATIYFNGPNGATATPGSLLVAQYPLTAVAGWLRGGNISAMPLATLQAINASLTLTIDGAGPTTETVNLTGATSFSNAAELIAVAFSLEGVELGSITASLATTVMTVTVDSAVVLAVGQVVTGTGIPANTYIASFGTGTGGVGTYNLSASCTTESAEAIAVFSPAVQYDSLSGAFVIYSGTTGATSSVAFASGAAATALSLTQVLGAVVSPGAAASAAGTGEAPFMNGVIAITQNWLSFMTTWEPVTASKEAFATWNNGALGGKRFRYVMWDTNIVNTESNGPSPAVAFITAGNLNGIVMIYENPAIDTIGGQIAAFMMGWAASLDFKQLNGASTADFKSQAGLQPQIMNGTAAEYLCGSPLGGTFGYGVNYYGQNSTPTTEFIYYARGVISGEFDWDDDYCYQVWLNLSMQLALLELLTTVRSIPYNAAGSAMIYGTLTGSAGGTDGAGPINNAVYFGMIDAGVDLSAEEVVAVNAAAGLNIAPTLFSQGWYLQILNGNAQTRRQRSSPPCNLWYTTGGSVQAFSLASNEVQ